VAVIGYGSQGSAQAHRLIEAGFSVQVGLLPGSKSRRRAKAADVPVTTPGRAVRGADTVVMLVPDQYANPLLADLAAEIEVGALVVFAAGFPLTFPRRPLPERCDIVLVSPHGPGSDLAASRQVSGFVGVHQDFTGKAWRRAHAYARAIGLKPVYESSAHDEAMGDLFGEQALLCGGLLTLTAAVAEIMVQRGLSKQNAYFETVAQLDRLTALLKDCGVEGFWNEISDCAAAGARDAADKIIDRRARQNLNRLYDEIASGVFAKKFYRSGRPARLPASWRVLMDLEAAVKK
jgi:ketol-acid reductoisomerase